MSNLRLESDLSFSFERRITDSLCRLYDTVINCRGQINCRNQAGLFRHVTPAQRGRSAANRTANEPQRRDGDASFPQGLRGRLPKSADPIRSSACAIPLTQCRQPGRHRDTRAHSSERFPLSMDQHHEETGVFLAPRRSLKTEARQNPTAHRVQPEKSLSGERLWVGTIRSPAGSQNSSRG